MLILTRAETEPLLDPDDLRSALAAAMAEVSAGRASMPARIAATVLEHGGMLAAMPAHLPGSGSLAAKLVSIFPGNAGTRLPTHQAVVVVFDSDSGRPLALIDGTSITAARTAAGSALSADLCSRLDSRVLAIIGSGVQARWHANAVARVRAFEQIRVAARDPAKAAALASELTVRLGIEVVVEATIEAACRDADVICATTNSVEPVIVRDALSEGVHVTSVGLNPAGREVDAATVADALVIVESREAALAPPPSGCNDLRLPLEEGRIGPQHIYAEIGELLSGARQGRTSARQITVYKSVGIAAQDAAAAAMVLRSARASGIGTEVDL